jgi:hypothetical protein
MMQPVILLTEWYTIAIFMKSEMCYDILLEVSQQTFDELR